MHSTTSSSRSDRDRHLQLDLGHELDDVFGAPVELGMALLTAESLDLGNRHALDAELREGGSDLVQLERLDDCGDEFHLISPGHESAAGPGARGAGAPARAQAIGHATHWSVQTACQSAAAAECGRRRGHVGRTTMMARVIAPVRCLDGRVAARKCRAAGGGAERRRLGRCGAGTAGTWAAWGTIGGGHGTTAAHRVPVRPTARPAPSRDGRATGRSRVKESSVRATSGNIETLNRHHSKGARMTASTFGTLTAARTLEAAGAEQSQAEAIAKVPRSGSRDEGPPRRQAC